MKLCRTEEGRRDFYAITLRIIGSAIVENVLPALKARRVRLTVQKVVVLLAHKVLHIHDGALRVLLAVVIQNRNLRLTLAAESRSHSVAQTERQRFITFNVRVFGD